MLRCRRSSLAAAVSLAIATPLLTHALSAAGQPDSPATRAAIAPPLPTTQPAGPVNATNPSILPDSQPATQPLLTQPTTETATTIPATNPAATTAPAGTQASTQPSDLEHPPAQIRLNFQDTPLDMVLEHLSRDAGLTIVREVPVSGRVTVISLAPLTPAEAILALDTVLKGYGLAAVQEGRTLRIVAQETAKKGNLPVHFGADPLLIEPTDELITQVIPVHNVDAIKLRQDLTPLLAKDADVTANSGANAIILTDTAANVRRVVDIVSILDKREGTTSQVKIIPLKNASASAAAKMVMALFHIEEPKGQPNQPPPPPKPREGRLLGTGVDQALYGGKVTAAADIRTNSVVVAAPAETLKVIEDMLKEIDENPVSAATPGIKSFHLKIADATTVARALQAVFQQDSGSSQSHQAKSEEPLNAQVTIVPEERTNTLIVTAPPSAMTVVEGLVKDVDGHPATASTVRSFPLKYADATAAAKELLAVFVDPNTGQSRLQEGSRDKVSATADSRTNTVLVTAPPEALPLVEQTIRDLDASPTNGADVKFFRLKQADSDATAKLILGFFRPPEGATDKRPPDSLHYGVNAVSDPRTNTVAVTAPEEAMKVIEQIVHEVETDPSGAFEIESFTLKNGDATAAAKLLTAIFQPDQPGTGAAGAKPLGIKDSPVKGKVVAAADDRTNSVVVTAPAETLKVIEGLMKLLDANPGEGAAIQAFQLQNADPVNTATLLQSIFQPTILQQGSNPNVPKPPGAADAIRRLGWVSANADERTSTLIVTAPENVLRMVGGIIHQLDANPGTQDTFFMYRLRNAQAQNLEVVLNQLFGNAQVGGTANQGIGLNRQQQTPQQLAAYSGGTNALGGSSGGLGASGLTSPAGGTGIGARRGTVSSGSASAVTARQLPSSMTRVLSELSGQVYVVADLDSNALLVTTATRFQKEVRDIIAELDRPVPQVLIKVLIAEVTHDKSADFGTDFSVLDIRKSGNGTTIAQNLGNAASNTVNGGLAVAVVESNVTVTLHALAQADRLDVLSRPYILASDNHLASITVGNEVPFITNTRLTDTGQTINTIQYQDVGIILNVTPHINPEGLVILDVAPEISQVTAQTVPISTGVDAPVIAKRSAQSRVGIKDGQTVVIGGLMEDRRTDTISKVPLLGDLPILGPIFSRTQASKTKTELLIFLTPHVAPQPDLLKPMSQDELNGTTLTGKAIEPGVFQQHLQGMRRGELPATQPTTSPAEPIIEFGSPAAPPSPSPGPATTGPIRLP